MNNAPEASQWISLKQFSRAGVMERDILGAAVLLNSQGLVKKWGGEVTTFARSLLKPWQMKAISKTLDESLNLEQKAISLSSHNGTLAHREVAQSILAGSQRQLQTPASEALGGGDEPVGPWTHPCSGKHAGILKACDHEDWPDDYLQESHPYHGAFMQELRRHLGVDWQAQAVAPDGCGLPNMAMSLEEMARLFCSLSEERERDWIWAAMKTHPELIGGKGRWDSEVCAKSLPVVAKEGADGLLGVSFEAEGEHFGFVLKLAHGYDGALLKEISKELLKDQIAL